MPFKHFFCCLTAAGFLAGCMEKKIAVPELQVGDRKVLVEEFTGVQCQDIVHGVEELLKMKDTLGDRLIIVNLPGANGYNNPFSNSLYDFRSEDCQAITEYLYVDGDPGAPAASIDRVIEGNLELFPQIFISRPWVRTIQSRADIAPDLGLFVSKNYNEASRELTTSLNISPYIPPSGEVRLSVYITEDSIVDLQKSSTQIITNYVHRYVFRDAVSAPTGDDISSLLGAGLPFTKTYAVTLPTTWVAKHCHIVAFVHQNGTPEHKQVLQADEIPVME
jgi:Outer membrane protein Omp28